MNKFIKVKMSMNINNELTYHDAILNPNTGLIYYKLSDDTVRMEIRNSHYLININFDYLKDLLDISE